MNSSIRSPVQTQMFPLQHPSISYKTFFSTRNVLILQCRSVCAGGAQGWGSASSILDLPLLRGYPSLSLLASLPDRQEGCAVCARTHKHTHHILYSWHATYMQQHVQRLAPGVLLSSTNIIQMVELSDRSAHR